MFVSSHIELLKVSLTSGEYGSDTMDVFYFTCTAYELRSFFALFSKRFLAEDYYFGLILTACMLNLAYDYTPLGLFGELPFA